jgi:hypothetical protein
MKRRLYLFAAILGALPLALGVYASTASSHAGKKTAQIRIESWLHGSGDPLGQSGTVKDCVKILLDGKVFDRAGKPTWDESTYTTTSDPCAVEGPAGGYVMLPPASAPPLRTVYAVHTIAAEKGNIFISFSGVYHFGGGDETVPYPDANNPTTLENGECAARWVITGGTGAYEGIQGEGTTGTTGAPCAVNFNNGLIVHTSVGQVSWR